jgi:hypothetical protein
LVGPLPLLDGNDMIITYVCHLTKQAHFFLCQSTITAKGLADMHVQHVFPLHGTPEKIISDCSLQFTTQMTKELYRLLGIEHAMSTSFHPQSNGQTECTNQEIGKYLCMFCGKDQDNWAKLLPIAEFAYNSHVHLASKASPFKLLYGYQPSWASPIGGSANIPSVKQCLAQLHKAQNKAKAALRMAKEAMVQSSKANWSRPTFQPGDKVWLDAKDLQIRTRSQKLADHCIGPFDVIALEESWSGPMYRLALLPSYKSLHLVFSVNRLLQWKGNEVNGLCPDPPPPVEFEDQAQPKYKIETILNSQKWGCGLQYLIWWKGYDKSHNQWISRTKVLRHTDEFVEEFHIRKPNAPRTVNALLFSLINWKLYKNFTETVHPGYDWTSGKHLGHMAYWDTKP